MQLFNTYKKLIVSGIFGITILGVFIYISMYIADIAYVDALRTQEIISNNDAQYNIAEQLLSESSGETYRKIFDTHVETLFKKEGINGMLLRIKDALSSGQIEMFTCHSLAHDIGHYGGYTDNFVNAETFITVENMSLCGSGFMHGVEAQLANNPDINIAIDDLYTFCKLVLPLRPYYNACYHGAGHSFMEVTSTPQEALQSCSRLKTDEFANPEACYRGVFSEHADRAMKSGKDSIYLLTFCSSLKSTYHQACAEELNGFDLSETATVIEIENAVKTCVNSQYSEIIQKGCLVSVAIVSTDRLLGQNKDVVPPPFLLSLQDEFVQAYMNATFSAFSKTSSYVSEKSLEPFCKSFRDKKNRTICFDRIDKSESI